MLQNRAVVPGKDFRRREAGQMDHAPKAIASSDKMMPCGGCGQSRIDPAEDHSKALREDIRQRISHDPVFARHPQITSSSADHTDRLACKLPQYGTGSTGTGADGD